MAYETNTIKERLTDTFGFTMVEKVEAECGPDCDCEEELARPGPKSAAQTPAPPKERIKGSKENPEGTAATRSKAGDIEISRANEQALKDKIAEFKKDHPKKNAPSLGTLKKVFRRGAGAFSTSFRPTITGGQPNSRNAWAMARVNKFLKMAGGGEVKESYRKADGDLLEERFEDCGTGAGGFKEGNTCAINGGMGRSGKETSKKYPNVSRVERIIKSLGVKKVDLFNNSKSADKVLSQVEELKNKGYDLPESIRVSKSETTTIAWASPREGSVSLNSKYSKKYEEIAKQQEASGNWSSSNPIAHEMGHNLHYKKIGNSRWDVMNNWRGDPYGPKEITSQVSKYSRMNPLEFVAETFAGHVSGKKYSKEVYDLYNLYEGPELK